MNETSFSLIVGIFQCYVIFKFMEIFFDRTEINKNLEFLTYVGYYVLVNLIRYFIGIPLITMIANVIFLLCITLLYRAPIKQRLMSVLFIYFILLATESIVVVLSGHLQLSTLTKMQYSSVWGLVLIQVIIYMEALILGNLKKLKRGATIPNSYWLSIFLIPSSALYIILLILSAGIFSVFQIILSIALLLFIISISFYLYDAITLTFEERMQNGLLQQQNSFYVQQFELLENSLKQTRMMRHDIKNHLLVMKSLISDNQKDEVLSYVEKFLEINEIDGKYAQSGNMMFDSILNCKLQEAEKKQIDIALELVIPQQLNATPFDMTIVLGNLFDNAIHAAEKLKYDRRIHAVIRYDKGRLMITIENTFDGNVQYEGGAIATSHKNKKEHGIGLENIRHVINKYNGTIVMGHEGRIFSVHVLMYM